MRDRAAKDALFDGFAEVAKALSSGRRAEIVDVLSQSERSVEDVAAEIDQSVANTSHHLRALVRAALLTTRRDGTRVFYALASGRVLPRPLLRVCRRRRARAAPARVQREVARGRLPRVEARRTPGGGRPLTIGFRLVDAGDFRLWADREDLPSVED